MFTKALAIEHVDEMHHAVFEYATCLSRNTIVDDGAGRALQALERKGLLENTLVVWWARPDGAAVLAFAPEAGTNLVVAGETLQVCRILRMRRRAAGPVPGPGEVGAE